MWCTTTIYKIFIIYLKIFDNRYTDTISHSKMILAETPPSRKNLFLKDFNIQMLTKIIKYNNKISKILVNSTVSCQAPFFE